MDDHDREIEGSIFEFLSSIFEEQDVRCVLVGGYALIANNVQRMTFDIDFLMTADDCARIEPILVKKGYVVLNRQDAFVQFKNKKPGFRDLDFLIVDAQTKEQMISQGRKIAIAGKTFTVPSPFHCIAMKIHSIAGNSKRELKDFPDIVQLMKANAIDPQSPEVTDLFKKYGLVNLHERILRGLGV